MELVREREFTKQMESELEAKHNAQISERYRMLQNAEADQFATEEEYSEPVRSSVVTPETTYVNVDNTPVVEQTPEVTDYVRERVTSSIFTAEKFNSLTGYQQNTAEMVITAPVIEQAPVTATVKETEAHYALTPLAKVAMGVFSLVVVGMLALIGVNSNIIKNQKLKIKNLEEKKNQLVKQHEEIQQHIENAQSEETIRAWAESQGMVMANGN